MTPSRSHFVVSDSVCLSVCLFLFVCVALSSPMLYNLQMTLDHSILNLSCHTMKCAGVTNNMNNGCILNTLAGVFNQYG